MSNNLVIIPRNGIIIYKNYNHFMFGILIPFVDLFMSGYFDCYKFDKVILPDIGENKYILKEVIHNMIPNIEITFVDNDSYIEYVHVPMYKLDTKIPHSLSKISISSFETFVIESNNWVKNHSTWSFPIPSCSNEISKALDEFYGPLYENSYDVLIIDKNNYLENNQHKSYIKYEEWKNLKNELKKLGLKSHIIVPSFLTLKQQISFFRKTKVVVAEHGAALSNIIFMRNQSKVIEIITKQSRKKLEWFEPVSKRYSIEYVKFHQNRTSLPLSSLVNEITCK